MESLHPSASEAGSNRITSHHPQPNAPRGGGGLEVVCVLLKGGLEGVLGVFGAFTGEAMRRERSFEDSKTARPRLRPGSLGYRPH
jgi:hypothetical protein